MTRVARPNRPFDASNMRITKVGSSRPSHFSPGRIDWSSSENSRRNASSCANPSLSAGTGAISTSAAPACRDCRGQEGIEDRGQFRHRVACSDRARNRSPWPGNASEQGQLQQLCDVRGRPFFGPVLHCPPRDAERFTESDLGQTKLPSCRSKCFRVHVIWSNSQCRIHRSAQRAASIFPSRRSVVKDLSLNP